MTKSNRQSTPPNSLPPIGLSREAAAAYIDVSPSELDEMVRGGRMPNSERIDSRRVWSRVAVEQAFARVPGGEEAEEDERAVS